MIRVVVLCAALLACGDNTPAEPDAAIDAALPECGDPPTPPYPTSLVYEAGSVSMSDADWQAIVEFRDRARNWFTCAAVCR